MASSAATNSAISTASTSPTTSSASGSSSTVCNRSTRLNALSDSLGITLVGPFEVLSGRFDGRSPRLSPLLHWRYYLDPPEFFTVLAGNVDRLHYGYYLDDPADGRGCVASYYADDAFELSADGDDLFEAVRHGTGDAAPRLRGIHDETPQHADDTRPGCGWTRFDRS